MLYFFANIVNNMRNIRFSRGIILDGENISDNQELRSFK